jgi:hypothetical protein
MTENVAARPGESEPVLGDEGLKAGSHFTDAELDAVAGGTTGAGIHAMLVAYQWQKCLDQFLPTGGACGD